MLFLLGIDIGGLFKDFLSDLSVRVFDPSYGLFSVTSDNLLYPNPSAVLLYPEIGELEALYCFLGIHYLYVYLFTYLLICLLIYLFIYLFTCLFIYLFIYLFTYLLIYFFNYLFIYSFIYLSIYFILFSYIEL